MALKFFGARYFSPLYLEVLQGEGEVGVVLPAPSQVQQAPVVLGGPSGPPVEILFPWERLPEPPPGPRERVRLLLEQNRGDSEPAYAQAEEEKDAKVYTFRPRPLPAHTFEARPERLLRVAGESEGASYALLGGALVLGVGVGLLVARASRQDHVRSDAPKNKKGRRP